MCYNVAYIERKAGEYAERYKRFLGTDPAKQIVPKEIQSYFFVSGFEHPQLPVVKQDGIYLYEWGLIPSWIKNASIAKEFRSKTLNAIGETVFEKSSFKQSIASKRCLLGINGFYEWRDCNKKKYPYYIHLKSHEIFSLGCIYETWVDKSTGEEINTFSILTTPANPLMESIHNLKKRMPLIIPESDEAQWVDPLLSQGQIKELIKPYDQTDMDAVTVTQNINNVRNNRNIPESMDKVEYPELNSLF